jgi:hypothetical protein
LEAFAAKQRKILELPEDATTLPEELAFDADAVDVSLSVAGSRVGSSSWLLAEFLKSNASAHSRVSSSSEGTALSGFDASMRRKAVESQLAVGTRLLPGLFELEALSKVRDVLGVGRLVADLRKALERAGREGTVESATGGDSSKRWEERAASIASAAGANDVTQLGRLLADFKVDEIEISVEKLPASVLRRPKLCVLLDVAVGAGSLDDIHRGCDEVPVGVPQREAFA